MNLLKVSLCLFLSMLPFCLDSRAQDEAPMDFPFSGYGEKHAYSVFDARLRAWDTWFNETDLVTGKRWGELIDMRHSQRRVISGNDLRLLKYASKEGDPMVRMYPSNLQEYHRSGIVMSLNPFIWWVRADSAGRPLRDSDGSWQYVLDEHGERILLWKEWESFPQKVRDMLMFGDEVFALPFQIHYMLLTWRKDVFEAAGLDPDVAPKTWDDVFEYSLRISAISTKDSKASGFVFARSEWFFKSIMNGFGADFALRYKTYGSNNEHVIERRLDEPFPKTAPDGTDLTKQGIRWRCVVDSPEMLEAIYMLRKIVHAKFVVDDAGEPIVVWLPDEEVKIQSDRLGEGRWEGDSVVFAERRFGPDEIRVGVGTYAYSRSGVPGGPNGPARIRMATTGDVDHYLVSMNTWGMDNTGISQMPSQTGEDFGCLGGELVGLNADLEENPEYARRAFAALAYVTSEQYRIRVMRQMVAAGEGFSQDPLLLKQEGFESVVSRFPSGLLELLDEVRDTSYPEFYAPFSAELGNRYFFPILHQALLDPFYRFEDELGPAQDAINRELQFIEGSQSEEPLPTTPLVGTLFLFVLFLVVTGYFYRSWQKQPAVSVDSRNAPHWVLFLLLGPVVFLLALFFYYPILQSVPMAFQDIKPYGESEWVGMSNFVEAFQNDRTIRSIIVTGYYVSLTVVLGFFLPFVLSLMLSEIPRFKYFFQTIFYAPATVSIIVMAVLWKQLMAPSKVGPLNQLMTTLGEEPQIWLEDERLALPIIVIIGVWAALGPGTLVYLAALRSIPSELYDTAVIEGAGWMARIRHVVIPHLKPLLIVNFVGVFIGAFKASENIFVLTGGGPNFSTQTFALELFMQTFVFMKLGYASALGWIMGALLIGFTVWQLNQLRRATFQQTHLED